VILSQDAQQEPCRHVNFDAGNDSRIKEGCDKGSAALLLLVDRFIIETRAADALNMHFLPVGPEDVTVGSPTQMGVFERKS